MMRWIDCDGGAVESTPRLAGAPGSLYDTSFPVIISDYDPLRGR
jgi:hypothetical protein